MRMRRGAGAGAGGIPPLRYAVQGSATHRRTPLRIRAQRRVRRHRVSADDHAALHQDAGPRQRLRRASTATRQHVDAYRRRRSARLADRRFGVGCDQVLVVERPTQRRGFPLPHLQRRRRRGRAVRQRRALLRRVRPRPRGSPTSARSASRPPAGVIVPRLEDDGEVDRRHGRAALSRPTTCRSPAAPVARSTSARRRRRAGERLRAVDGQSARRAGGRRRRRRAGGNARARASSAIRAFHRRVNAGYMQVVDRATIRLRVWERGAGETLACGTGACAAVVAGIRRGLLDSHGARRRRAAAT